MTDVLTFTPVVDSASTQRFRKAGCAQEERPFSKHANLR